MENTSLLTKVPTFKIGEGETRQDLMNRLPNEIMEKIFFYLGPNSAQAALRVCYSWNCNIMDQKKSELVSHVNDFIKMIIVHLDQDSIAVCKAVSNEIAQSKPTCLKEIKKFSDKAFTCLIIQLDKLSDSQLQQLTEICKIEKNIFSELPNLSSIYKRLDRAYTIKYEITRVYAINDVIQDLSVNDKVDMAIDIANAEVDKLSSSYLLGRVIKALLASGNVNRAMEISITISDEDQKAYAIHDIVRDLLVNGNVDKAIGITNNICNNENRAEPLLSIVKHLVVNCHIEKAKLLANTIFYEPTRMQALEFIEMAK